MKYKLGHRCRECKSEYSISPIQVCEFCFGPLEVIYGYEKIKGSLTRGKIEGVHSDFDWILCHEQGYTHLSAQPDQRPCHL